MYRKHIIILLLMSFFSIIGITLFALLSASILRKTAQAATQTTTCGKWNNIPGANTSLSWNTLNSVSAIASNNMWALGYTSPDGANYRTTLTEHWNGTQWSIVTSPNATPVDNTLFGVSTISTKDVWALGDYSSPGTYNNTLVEHWNGSQWSVVPSPNSAIGNDMLNGITALSATNIWRKFSH